MATYPDETAAKAAVASTFVTGTPTRSAQHRSFLNDLIETMFSEAVDGNNGWTPTFTVVADGERRVIRITSWEGGAGTAPATGYLGASGIVADAANATNIRGATGATGQSTNGIDGNDGWSPVFVIVASGERRVLRLQAWVGGTGAQPSGVGQYVGSTGLVPDAASASDIRGPAGADGGGGGGTGTAGRNGDLGRLLYYVAPIGATPPASPGASNPTYIESSGTVNFGNLATGWGNTYPLTQPDFTTQTLWASWVWLRFSADNSSVSVLSETPPFPISPVRDGGGGTPPSPDFTFGWREGASGAFNESMTHMNGVAFDITTIATVNGTTGFTFRVPSTHRITSIRAGFSGVYGNNQIASWTENISGGFATYTRSDLIGPGNFNWEIIGGSA